jgi:hypothetical protein
MTAQGRTLIRRINSAVTPSIFPVIDFSIPTPASLRTHRKLSPPTEPALTLRHQNDYTDFVAYNSKLHTEKRIEIEQLSTLACLVFSPFAQT